MSNLSDKEIDRLGREASDLYEPDSSTLSWSRLEQKLIEQMPERPPDGFRFGRISPYVWGPAVVLLAGISFYFIKNQIYSQLSTRTSEQINKNKTESSADSRKSETEAFYTDSISSAQGTGTSQDEKGKQSGSLNSETAKNSQAGSDAALANGEVKPTNSPVLNSPAAATDKPASNKDNRSKAMIPAVVIAGGSSAHHENMAPNKEAPGKRVETNGSNETPTSGATITTTAALEVANSQSSDANSINSSREASSHQLPTIVSSGIGLGTVKGNDSLLNKLAQKNAPAQQKSMHINRSLNIGFTLGADYTDAGGIPNNQFSNNIGITLGYYLTSKLSVNTGLIYSNKFYWSPGHGPDRPSNYPPNGNPSAYAYAPDIEYVNGACNMYELPLTLRYDFASNDRTKFFVNAGLSSYFMLKQTYIYFFHSGGRTMARKANDEVQANYWFGVGDLSFGLESDIGKGFSFQAEPFFRIPLQKMGLENLKMYSYGFMLSVRYAPVLSRSKK